MKFWQTNQHFRTLDLIGLLFVFGIVTSALGALMADAFKDNRPDRSRAMVEALALQLMTQSENSSHQANDPSRLPASVEKVSLWNRMGDMGRDPWGRPYHFLVQSGSSRLRVFVWSSGPNGKSESREAIEAVRDLEDHKPFRFLGDDIGSLQVSR